MLAGVEADVKAEVEAEVEQGLRVRLGPNSELFLADWSIVEILVLPRINCKLAIRSAAESQLAGAPSEHATAHDDSRLGCRYVV